jgi:uncharacterized protein (TIGR02147 family)
MITIFDYLDYRLFLREWYEHKKAENAAISYQWITQRAGLKSKSVVAAVIGGSRHLSSDSVFKIAEVIGLEGKALAYFQDLVALAKARTRMEQDHCLQRLMHYNHRSEATLLRKSHYEFYAHWYHNTILQIITSVDFNEDYEWLGSLLQPAIAARTARASVRLLLRLELVRKEQGRYVLTQRAMTTGDEVRSVAVRAFHRQALELATEAIDTIASEEREISCVLGVLSAEGFAQAKKEIQQFRQRMAQLMRADQGSGKVHHFQFQLYPTSKPYAHEDNHDKQ